MKLLSSRGILSESEADTLGIGALMARSLTGGIVILLEGELGVGKTTLVRGFCEFKGFWKVRSPSFTLVNQYSINEEIIVHSDLYRLEPGDIKDLDLDGYWNDDSLVFVEWAERGYSAEGSDAWKIRFSVPETENNPRNRLLEFSATEGRGEEMLVSFFHAICEVLSL